MQRKNTSNGIAQVESDLTRGMGKVGHPQTIAAMRLGLLRSYPYITTDSPRKAGYETDADESELSEWESGNVRQGPGAYHSLS